MLHAFWATYRTVCYMLSDCCPVWDIGVLWPNGWNGLRWNWPHVRWGPSSPSLNRGFSAHICCGQMAAWTKKPLGMEVGLGPGDFVLNWDPAPFPQKGRHPSPNFRHGWMDQAGSWHGGGPQSSSHCARWGASYPPQKGDRAPSHTFWPISVVAKWLDASRCHLVWT